MNRDHARRLLAKKKRDGKTADQARREVARQTGYPIADLTTIDYGVLNSSSYDSGTLGSPHDSGSGSYDSGSSSCDSGGGSSD